MRFSYMITIVLAITVPAMAETWVVEELGGEVSPSSWTYYPAYHEISITENEGTNTFVFRAYDDDLPGDPTANISLISTTLASGEIHLQVGESGSGNQGAIDIGAITIEAANITSVIEGIYITGGLFTEAASVVDYVDGPIEVGGSLVNAMTVNQDLAGAVTIDDDVDGAVTVTGSVTAAIARPRHPVAICAVCAAQILFS